MGRRRKGDIPKLLVHTSSGRAYVNDPATGKPSYLGAANSPEANQAYDRWVREYLARKSQVSSGTPPGEAVLISTLAADYLLHARSYYRKGGRETSTVARIANVLDRLVKDYGNTLADEFRPSHLRAHRDRLIVAGHSRSSVNQECQIICRVFRWGVSMEVVKVETHGALLTVRGLARGRTAAREPKKIKPVAAEDFEKTLPCMRPQMRTLARVHWLLGRRAGEVVAMRGDEIDRTRQPWVWVLSSWKTEHHEGDREAVVMIGPQAQKLLAPLLLKYGDGYLFPSARDGVAHILETSYYKAVRNACRKAKVKPWVPLQVRHSRLTEVRERYGLEGAQAVGGHKEVETTQIYAEKSQNLARKIAEETG